MKHLFQSSQDHRTAWKPTGVKHKFSESHKSIWHIMNRTRFTVINIRWGNKFDPLPFCYFYRASIQISWILQDVSFTACENTPSHHRWTDDLWGSNLWCWPIIIPEQSWECLEKQILPPWLYFQWSRPRFIHSTAYHWSPAWAALPSPWRMLRGDQVNGHLQWRWWYWWKLSSSVIR